MLLALLRLLVDVFCVLREKRKGWWNVKARTCWGDTDAGLRILIAVQRSGASKQQQRLTTVHQLRRAPVQQLQLIPQAHDPCNYCFVFCWI